MHYWGSMKQDTGARTQTMSGCNQSSEKQCRVHVPLLSDLYCILTPVPLSACGTVAIVVADQSPSHCVSPQDCQHWILFGT